MLSVEKLPAPVRERMERILVRGGAPEPLLSAGRGDLRWPLRVWTGLAIAALVVEIVAWVEAFGRGLAEPRLSPTALACVHFVAVAGGLFAASLAVRLARSVRAAPWIPGAHLFELDLIEVEGAIVRVTSLDTLSRVEGREGARGERGAITLRFLDGHEVDFDDQEDAPARAASVMDAVKEARELTLPADEPRLSRIDPLHELRVADDWASAEVDPAGRGEPWLARSPAALLAALAAGVGLAVGAATLHLGARRLIEIDDARFEEARHLPPPRAREALQEYIVTRGRHVEDAKRELFQIQRGSLIAMCDYVDEGGPLGIEAAKVIGESDDVDALAGLLTGPTGEKARAAVDARLYEIAKRTNTRGSYRWYVEHEGRRSEEAAMLEEMAAFQEARAKRGYARELYDYLAAYPKGANAAEVRAYLKELIDRELTANLDAVALKGAPRKFWEAIGRSLVARGSPEVALFGQWTVAPYVLGEAEEKLAATLGDDLVPGAAHFKDLDGVQASVPQAIADRLQSLFPGGLASLVTSPDPSFAGPRITVTLFARSEPATLRVAGYQFSRIHLEVAFEGKPLGPDDVYTWKAATPLSDADLADLVAAAPPSASPAAATALGEKLYRRMSQLSQASALSLILDRL